MRHPRFLCSTVFGLVLAAASLVPQPAWAGTLWLGTDGAGFYYQIDTAGNLLSGPFNDGVPGETTGIAFDGTNLWTSSYLGTVTEHNGDGTGDLGNFFVNPTAALSEDMAWDGSRDLLWRITHSNGTGPGSFIQGFDRAGNLEHEYEMPVGVDGFLNMGGLGIAYDPTRDLLYASFCHAGCSGLADGVVLSVNPSDGTSSVLFLAGYATGGLGYDPGTDTLWVGDYGVVRNVDLSGAVNDTVSRPFGGNFADGLEFVETVPEPGTLTLLGTGLVGLAAFLKKRNA